MIDYLHTECLRMAFPEVESAMHEKWMALGPLYAYWNERLNLISRRDIAQLYPKHILHSLALSKLIALQPGATILDVGTGGGFPGIPLAIRFPQTHFCLVDSIQKKIKAVQAIAQALSLPNVTTHCTRVEAVATSFDFILARAVTSLPKLYLWTHAKIKAAHMHTLPNGLFCWKGGDVTQELAPFPHARTYPLHPLLHMPFLKDKVIVHLPQKETN